MERKRFLWATTLVAVGVLASAIVDAHGVSDKDALFLSMINGPAIGPLMVCMSSGTGREWSWARAK